MLTVKLLLIILGSILNSMTDFNEQQLISRELDSMGNYENRTQSIYDSMLVEASNHWGIPATRIDNIITKIGYHESHHTMDPMIKQRLSDGTVGRGRGIFQFEVSSDDKQGGGATAFNRSVNYFNNNEIPKPDWVLNANYVDDFDATTLDSLNQRILMLANMRQEPVVTAESISDVFTNEDIAEFWLNSHWKGDVSDRLARKNSFLGSVKKYDSENPTENMLFE